MRVVRVLVQVTEEAVSVLTLERAVARFNCLLQRPPGLPAELASAQASEVPQGVRNIGTQPVRQWGETETRRRVRLCKHADRCERTHEPEQRSFVRLALASELSRGSGPPYQRVRNAQLR